MEVRICPDPVFVVGAPRSGTSMMQWALRQHPDLWGGQESDYLQPLIAALRDVHGFGSRRGRLHWLSGQRVSWEEFVVHVGYGVNALYASRAGTSRWVEQTPLYTLLLDDLATMFPGASFVWMLRDGREVAHSLRHFEANRQDLPEGSATWRRYSRAALDFHRSSRGHRMHVVRFADVVADPDARLAEVFDFLGLPHAPASARWISERPLNSSFPDDVDGRDERERWRSWTSEEQRMFADAAGDAMDELFPGWSS